MDLLKLVQMIPTCPPLFKEEFLDKFGEKVKIPPKAFPTPFASARFDEHGRKIPQVIAHRGYKAKYPENSIQAFEAAVEAGAQALETDLHLSKDGVVVLSHDPNLKRCFGVDQKIKDCEWSFLKTLRTTQAPNENLPSLQDLLELFQKPQWRNIWLLLDIKTDDEPEELMYRLAETFRNVNPGHYSRWEDKVLLGFWTAKFIPLCNQYFPEFSVTNIGFCPAYCREFLAVPNISFNVLYSSLIFPPGRSFIQTATAQHRQVLVWTVNDEKGIDWCVKKGVDGIVTDDIAKVLEVYGKLKENTRYGWPARLLLQYMYFNFWIFMFGVILRRRYGSCIDRRMDDEKNK